MGKPPAGIGVKHVLIQVDELKETKSRVVSATADRVWKRSEGLSSGWVEGGEGSPGCGGLVAVGAWIEL